MRTGIKVSPTFLFLLISLVPLSGCFTSIAIMQTSPESQNPRREVLRDTILALGRARSQDQIPALLQEILFIGEKNSFFISEGGSDIFEISKNLDGNRLSLDPYTPSLYTEGDRVWGFLTFFYSLESNQDQPNKEVLNLQKSGFHPSSKQQNRYERKVEIKGQIFPKMEIPENLKHSLITSRLICFYTPPKHSVIPAIKRTAVLPFAIAADILTSPIQIIGFTCLLFTHYP